MELLDIRYVEVQYHGDLLLNDVKEMYFTEVSPYEMHIEEYKARDTRYAMEREAMNLPFSLLISLNNWKLYKKCAKIVIFLYLFMQLCCNPSFRLIALMYKKLDN